MKKLKLKDKLLLAAAEKNRIWLAGLMLTFGANIEAKGELGYTALSLASRDGYLSMVKFLISKGANVNTQSYLKRTPMMQAIRGGCHLEVVKYLYSKGARINTADKNEETALMYAARGNYIKLMEYLIVWGADIDAKNKDGCTSIWLVGKLFCV